MMFVVIFLMTFGAISAQSPLKIHLFYESLCPDSRDFVVDQLKPTYSKLADWIEIIFVPFGIAKSINGGKAFKCQHGPAECLLNRVQSCTLARLDSEKARESYVGCQMSKLDQSDSGEACVEDTLAAGNWNWDWNDIEACLTGLEGQNLQLAAEQEQKSIIGEPQWIPTVVFNGTFNQQLQDRSTIDGEFFEVTCEILNHVPPACRRYNVVKLVEF